jgi:hypothetical protein
MAGIDDRLVLDHGRRGLGGGRVRGGRAGRAPATVALLPIGEPPRTALGLPLFCPLAVARHP